MSADSNFVLATIIYDPLDLENRQTVELEYQPGKALSHYIDGLPEEHTWEVALDSAFIPEEGYALTFPQKGSHITVAPVPHGGDSDGKQILMLVATIALSFAAPAIGTALAGNYFGGSALAASMIGAGVSIAGGLLINAFLPRPDQATNEDAQTYGIDGPKNTSQEGLPVPVIFGRHGFGGNIIDMYTENSTDSNGQAIQFLYARTLVSEGPINSIGDFHFNGQPISSFEDVETDFRHGGSDQQPSEWFDRTITLYNQSRDFTENFQTYETVGEVDKIRLDVAFPLGLIFTDNKGREWPLAVDLIMECRRLGSTDPWQGISSQHAWTDTGGTSGTGDKFRVHVKYVPAIQTDYVGRGDKEVHKVVSPDPDYSLEYRVNGGAWTEHERYTRGPRNGNTTSGDAAEIVATIDGFSNDTVEFRVVNHATGDFPATITVSRVELKGEGVTGGSPVVTIDEVSTTPLRYSFISDQLPEARYEIRFRRGAPEIVGESNKRDKATLVDVGEIITDPVSLIHSAWAGYKIKLSGQLSAIPTFTGVAEGMIMPIYDHEGNVVDNTYSNNPADVALHAYMNRRWGGKIEPQRIDFVAFSEWREYCEENNFTCNILFSDIGNIDEQLKHCFIAGRAQRVTQGAKLSVITDSPSAPVMMFNSTLIEKNSLEMQYLPFTERVNDLSVTYYDEENDYQSATVRAVNDVALARGEELRSSSIQVKGITSRSRAQREANFRMNYNRLITRTASWVSPLHAISCTVGDVVILQTDMFDWKAGGLVRPGSTATTLKLDREVEMQSGVSYSVLLHRDKRRIASTSITSQTGSMVTVSGVLPEDGSARRLKKGGKDYAILRVIPGSSTTDLILKDAPALSGSVEIWSTDVLDEIAVNNPGTGSYDTITLSTAAQDGPPTDFSTFIFGASSKQNREFRITEMSREGAEKISITAVEYVPEVYDDDDIHTGIENPGTEFGAHVINLTAAESSKIGEGGARFIEVQVAWQPGDDKYLAAMVQYKIDDGPWREHGETSDTSARIPVVRGDYVTVRVVARTALGMLPVSTAPVVELDIVGFDGVPEAPLNWTAKPDLRSITFSEPKDVDRSSPPYDSQLMFGDPTFQAYQIWSAAVGAGYETSSKEAEFSASTFTLPKELGFEEKTYWITVVDGSGNVSTPSLPMTVGKDSIAPKTPYNLTAVGYFQMVKLDWVAVTENEDGTPILDLAGYRIYRHHADDFAMAEMIATVPAPATTFDDTGLPHNTTYYYWITAVDWSDNESAPSTWPSDATTDFIKAEDVVANMREEIGAARIDVVSSLPDASEYGDDDFVYLTTDGKLYKKDGAGWTAVAAETVIEPGSITETHIGNYQISTNKIASYSISANKISSGAITSSKLATNSVVAGKISAGAVSAYNIAVDNLAAIKADLGAVTAGSISTLSGGVGIQANVSGKRNAFYAYQNNTNVYALYGKNTAWGGGAAQISSSGGFTVQAINNTNGSGSYGSYCAFVGQQNGGGEGKVGVSTGHAFESITGGFRDSAGGGFSPFTGRHEAMMSKSAVYELGDIVVDAQLVAKSLSDAFTEVEVSTQANMPNAVGVLSQVYDEWFIPAAFIVQSEPDPDFEPTPEQPAEPVQTRQDVADYESDYDLVMTNSVGEGCINVCGRNGDIQKGDLIVTSTMPGKGMRQDDDIIRSRTVAKAREDVVFSHANEVKQIACIYMCG